jgi:predicted SnoaL-like aldol condensation-catalyzing enzyme
MTSSAEQSRNVLALYDLMFNPSRPAEAIARYAGPPYIQHNPYVRDGKQGFINYVERMAAEYPRKLIEFKRHSPRTTRCSALSPCLAQRP